MEIGLNFGLKKGIDLHRDSMYSFWMTQVFVLSTAVQEATSAFKIWLKAKEDKEQQEIVKNDKKPPHYRHVKVSTTP